MCECLAVCEKCANTCMCVCMKCVITLMCVSQVCACYKGVCVCVCSFVRVYENYGFVYVGEKCV
jgi:hypothetical protein